VSLRENSNVAASWLQSRRLREHLLLSIVFVLSRVALHALGFRLNFSLNWMFLSDAKDLRERLLETIYYFHAYPPGMDLITGLLLKAGGDHAPTLALWLFCGFGLLLVNSFYRLCRVSGFSYKLAFGLALAFACIPQTLYFEHLYLYTMPTASLLALAAALFHRGVRAGSFRVWFGFFLTCALIGWVRSMFHLVWFVAMIALGVWFSPRGQRRTVLVACAAPFALLLALFLKNYVLFGVFGSTSAGGGNLTHVTIRRMPAELRERWIEEGKLSPFARINVYASPREYRDFFGNNPGPTGAGLEGYEKPSVNAPNYNHWSLIPVSRTRSADALYYIQERPFEYAAVVLEGLRQIFEPSTTWHPLDKRPGSPHYEHRQLLGGYEAFYNGVVHGFPFAPIGVYALLPFAWFAAFLRARSLSRTPSPVATARAALLYFCLLQILFVVTVSSLFTVGESSRYRFQIESLIWLVTAVALSRLARISRRSRRAKRAALAHSSAKTTVRTRS
jgi:hypothetical protein